jgi:hypothetical protein
LKNIIKSVSVLAALTSLAFAGDDQSAGQSKDLKKVIEDQGIYVETAKPGITLSGYVDAGYSYNFAGNGTVPTRFGTDGGTTTSSGTGSNFNLNAFKLAIEKPLSTKNELSAGFRADLIYGDDASALGGTGSNTASSNNVLVEQAFVQLNAPIGNGINFKVGKFVTPLGYEVIERPANQNITYGNLFVNTIPLYHTGVLASYKVNDIIDVKGGVVNGNNNDYQSAFGEANRAQGASLLGTVNVTAPGGNANIQQGVFISLNGAGGNASAASVQSFTNDTETSATDWVYDIVGQWSPKFDSKLNLGFNGDFGEVTTNVLGAGTATETTFGGAALYAKYQFTKLFSLATRTDWLHENNDGKFSTSNGGANDIYSFTATGSFDVFENTLLRAEYRCDYGSEGIDSLGGSSFAGNSDVTHDKGLAQLVDLEVVYSF